MTRFDLAAMTRRARNPRRSVIPIRPIQPPAVRATDLYQAGYAATVAVWSEAIPTILAEYERTLAQLTTDAPSDVAVQIGVIENRAAAIALTIRLRLENWARRLERWHAQRWRANVLSATGVELATIIGPEDARMTVEAAVERNVGLVKSVSDQTRQRIADSVFRGFQQRKPAREVAAEIREAVGMARRRALNIAADQSSKLASALDDERRRQAGIMAWEWVHSGKAHPRAEHQARNGNLYSDDPADVGEEYQGQRVAAPPADRPAQLPYCGCTSRAVLILN